MLRARGARVALARVRHAGGRRPRHRRRRRAGRRSRAASTATRRWPSDDERLAAIQKAMNELAPAAQQCWAAVAAIRAFDIEGELAAQIDIGAAERTSRSSRDTDEATATLAACMTACSRRTVGAAAARPDDPAAVRVHRARRPERDRSPARAVRRAGQGLGRGAARREQHRQRGGVDVRGRDRAGRRDRAARPPTAPSCGTSSTPASVSGRVGKPTPVAAGDMMYVPKGGAREVARDRRATSTR